ncbi:MAG: hypothetical protein A2096_01075 [Spirochaetes bacterium GWF1_41_5]|nr:MAG: hypothetical protein A2096_01075 [Spirochaetes bacterium GWF1_41_5]HBE03158.1 hypothetical protein [Spirochaetia bacterium]
MPYDYTQFDTLMMLSLLTALGCLGGNIALIFFAFKNRSVKDGLFSIIIPFYPVKILFSMPEDNFRKTLMVLYFGGFMAFLFINILKIIMTPQF